MKRIDRLLAKKRDRKARRRSPDECRIHDLNKLARFRYGRDFVLPDNADGRALAIAMITHQPYKPSEWLDRFCRERTPWLDPDEIDRKQLHPKKAAALGQDLNLSAVERLVLKICSIRPYDMTRAELTAWLKKRKRRREAIAKQARRRIAGQQSRAEYLATHSASRIKPWEAEGVSRRTWYRRRGTSLSPTMLIIGEDTPVPSRFPLGRAAHSRPKPDSQILGDRAARSALRPSVLADSDHVAGDGPVFKNHGGVE
jgi:hypothetical protein